ncbi:hypothetical protein BGZ47_000832 [Haplosporangium gracile]|nr:hypothetical protein BGZ47_000832 [Haplosporangium gracile]
MAKQINEKSEYNHSPKEKSTLFNDAENKIELHEEKENEFIDEPKRFTAYACFDMFFAVPLRAHFVINQDLVFPTFRAAADTIKSLHRACSSAAKGARECGIIMGVSFVISVVWGALAHFITSLLGDLHILYYMDKAAANTAFMDADEK